MGGTNTSTSTGDVIQFVTIATVGNWSDFGNLTTGRHSAANVVRSNKSSCRWWYQCDKHNGLCHDCLRQVMQQTLAIITVARSSWWNKC